MSATVYTEEFYQGNRRGSLDSAREIIPIVFELVQPHSVVELGCGVGAWLSVLKDYGVKEILGVDGDYVPPKEMLIPGDCFLPFNLRKPIILDKIFDLAISLEVAEHLDRSCSESFVASLAQLAPIVLFSAAIPFQGGTHHVNEQWPDFWARLFHKQGFVTIDYVRRRVWNNKRVEWWYAQNTLIYARRDLVERDATLKAAYVQTSSQQLNIVHPAKYTSLADTQNVTLRNIFHLIPKTAMRTASRRFQRFRHALWRPPMAG